MYVSEISPLNLRGGLGTVNQLAVTVGLLISQVLGIEQILGTNEGWPLLLGLAVLPALLQLLLLPVCPESPRYLLITKQWEEESRRALRRLRANNQVKTGHAKRLNYLNSYWSSRWKKTSKKCERKNGLSNLKHRHPCSN